MALVFYSNVLSLEKLAFYRIALTLWRNTLLDHPLKRNLPSSDNVAKKFYVENHSSIDTYLRDTLVKCIQHIRENLNNLLREPYDGLYRETFANDGDTWMKYFDLLAWNAENYTIDWSKTCLNLLLDDRLGKEEKFAMACSYCLEHHIKDVWNDVRDPDGLSVKFTSPWPLLYWIDRMKNQPSCENISDTFDENDMIESMPLNRWIIEYFWQYLTSDGHFRMVSSMMSAKDANCLKHFLPKLNEEVLQKVLSQRGADIVEVLIENDECRPLAVPFWNHVRHVFDSDQFFELVRWMLTSEVGALYCHKLSEEEVSLCQEIWSSAPHELKETVLYLLSVKNSIFMEARVNDMHPYRDLRVSKMILSEASPEQRNRMWSDNWLKFCSHGNISDINEMIELCLTDANERTEFRRQNMMELNKIQRYCSALLDNFEFLKFDDFLKFCSTDRDSFVDLKHRLMRLYFFETYAGCSNLYFERIDEFMAFLDSSFADTEQRVSFKKEFVSKREYLDRLLERLYDGDFVTIKSLVAACLSSEQEINQWKEEFVHYCHYCLTTGCLREFDSDRWQDFIVWCLGNEGKVTDFKRSLGARLDDVFEMFLERCESIRETKWLHKIFDKLLKWCLDGDSVAAFKRKYIEANPNDDDIYRLLFGKRPRRE